MSKQKPNTNNGGNHNTRAEANRANAKRSTGPKSKEGKSAASANSLKHGFFAHVEKLHPTDSAAFQQLHDEFRLGLHPDGPVEELLTRVMRAQGRRGNAAA